jgi:pimeloyl-ACP methyl ester carboxylesterase
MRWLERGQGMPVVLVHGIPTSPLLWRKVLPLVPGARLLAWEMVGYGDSIEDGQKRDISVAKQAEYLRAFMQALGLERAVLVGHDLGGGVAQIAALAESARCAGLVLADAIGYDSWPVAPILLTAKLGTVVGKTPGWLFFPNFAAIVASGYGDPAVARESTQLHFTKYSAHGGAEAFVRQARALHTRDTLAIQERLPELRGLPARVVWGEADPFQRLRYGKRFADDLECPLDVIPGGKHFVPEEHPEPLAEAILWVLDKARRRA